MRSIAGDCIVGSSALITAPFPQPNPGGRKGRNNCSSTTYSVAVPLPVGSSIAACFSRSLDESPVSRSAKLFCKFINPSPDLSAQYRWNLLHAEVGAQAISNVSGPSHIFIYRSLIFAWASCLRNCRSNQYIDDPSTLARCLSLSGRLGSLPPLSFMLG